jgi:hypothetical protein
MKIGYTVFHSKEYGFEELQPRSKNVERIHDSFGKIADYVHNEAIIVKDLPSYKASLKKYIDLRKISLCGSFRFGAVGLAFTTFLAYKKLLETDYEMFLIFEDDAELNTNSVNLTKKYLEEVPENFDVLSLYENKAFYSKYNTSHEIGLENICRFYNDRSTLVYAISRSGIQKYYEHFKILIDLPVDLYLFDNKKNTNKYAIKPTAPQPFSSNFFLQNGDPDLENSYINKTKEFFFK